MKPPRKTKQQNLEAKLYSIREIYVYNSQTMRYLFENFLFLVWITVRMISHRYSFPPIVRRMRLLSSFRLCVLFKSLFNQEVKLLATESQCYRKYVF